MSHIRLPVEEFTTPNPVTALEDSTLEQLTDLMKKNGIRHLPVVKDTRVVGIVSDRDLRVASGLSKNQKNIVVARDIMSADPVAVSSGMPLDEVAFQMSEQKIGSVIVNDESDEFLGIFTVTDALNALIEIVRAAENDEDLEV